MVKQKKHPVIVNTTTTGADQLLVAENVKRSYFELQNQSDTDIYINFDSVAYDGTNALGFKVPAGGSYNTTEAMCPQTPIHIYCASASKKFAYIEV